MRHFYIALILAATCLPFGSLAADGQQASIAPALEPDLTPAQNLDRLFAELKRTRDSDVAEAIAGSIADEWRDSHSATVNLLMQWADTAISEKRYPAALDFLDQAIALKPDYAEGWNRRATLHYEMGNYRRSMEDITQVLKLEPRHFGALAGLAAILALFGNDKGALDAWQSVLDFYPANRQAQDQVKELQDRMEGTRT